MRLTKDDSNRPSCCRSKEFNDFEWSDHNSSLTKSKNKYNGFVLMPKACQTHEYAGKSTTKENIFPITACFVNKKHLEQNKRFIGILSMQWRRKKRYWISEN
jgi:hypothetical protein